MTCEEISNRLGLMPTEEWNRKAYDHNRSELVKVGSITIDLERGTGRTTAMLVYAAGLVSNGKAVMLVAHTVQYATRLTRDLQDMCRTCGIETDGLVEPGVSLACSAKMRGSRAEKIFDHYASAWG